MLKEITLEEALVRVQQDFEVHMLKPQGENKRQVLFNLNQLLKDNTRFLIEDEVVDIANSVFGDARNTEIKDAARKHKDLDLGKLEALYKAKWTTKQVAEEMKIAESVAYYYKRKLGLVNPK